MTPKIWSIFLVQRPGHSKNSWNLSITLRVVLVTDKETEAKTRPRCWIICCIYYKFVFNICLTRLLPFFTFSPILSLFFMFVLSFLFICSVCHLSDDRVTGSWGVGAADPRQSVRVSLAVQTRQPVRRSRHCAHRRRGADDLLRVVCPAGETLWCWQVALEVGSGV